MSFFPGLDELLQSRPPSPPGAAELGTFLLVLAGLRLIGGPVFYFAARNAKGREVWWGLLAILSPLVALVAFATRGRPRSPTGTNPWNPWIQCPYCATPRGYTNLPCPRCGQLLPAIAFPAPPSTPPPAAPYPPRPAGQVGYVQVIGAILFVTALAGVAGLLMVVPLISGDPLTAEAEVARLLETPAFILLAVAVQDSIMIGVALDQAIGRKRLTGPKMGFRLRTDTRSFPALLAIGVGAGLLTFAFTAVSGQILIDFLKSLGMSQGSQPLPGQPTINSLSDYFVWLVIGVVIAPLAEEMFFRGYALGGLASRGLQNRGLLFTSVLFALVHFEPLFFAQLMAAGLVLGALYLRTGSLVSPIVGHMTNNFLVMTAILFGI